jgi:hypothetical protein
MKTFKIEIQELLARVVDVEAIDLDDAISKLNDQYENEEIVLDYDDFVAVDFIEINAQSQKDEINILAKDVLEYIFSTEHGWVEKMENAESLISEKLARVKSLMSL